jgi:hypothetical protein
MRYHPPQLKYACEKGSLIYKLGCFRNRHKKLRGEGRHGFC